MNDILSIFIGYVVVWDISADKDKTKSIANKNKERKYIKSVKLEKSSILVIVYKNGYIFSVHNTHNFNITI